MFTPDVSESTRIAEMSFIAGIPYEALKQCAKEILKFENIQVKPEILFSFPDNKGIIYNSVLDFVFPTKINISYNEEKPKFYTIVLTNEQGMRTYCYILKIFEKINVSNLISENKTSPRKETKKMFNEEDVIRKLLPSFKEKNTEEQKTCNLRQTEQEEYENKMSLSYQGKSIFVPYAFCIWSTVSKIDFFKGVLNEFYKILTYNNDQLSDEIIRIYRNCEILHLMIFLSNIVKPPSNIKMTVNLRFSNLEFLNNSVYEIPSANSHIKVLFELLEISSIIKLWCSLLSEKHIIILANQNFLLYSISEALLALIFPFKWLHTYIPVLPQEQIDYLESPTPYIMGVLSSYTDLDYLKECFPNHIICDVNTSIVYGNSFCSLPIKEEAKLRKKIQYAKNPQIYSIEEIDTESEIFSLNPVLNHNMIYLKDRKYSQNPKPIPSNITLMDIEDVNFSRSFSENVQYIFFRIFRNSLNEVKHNYIIDNTFDSQRFLEDFHDENLREFWEKIINTAAFEYFILSFNHLDDSLTNLFKNVCKGSDDYNQHLNGKDNLFNFSLTLPNYMDLIFKQIEINKRGILSLDKLISDYNKAYNTFLSTQQIPEDKFRSTFVSNQSGGNGKSIFTQLKGSLKKIKVEKEPNREFNLSSSHPLKNSILDSGKKKHKERHNNLSYDFVNFKSTKTKSEDKIVTVLKESLEREKDNLLLGGYITNGNGKQIRHTRMRSHKDNINTLSTNSNCNKFYNLNSPNPYSNLNSTLLTPQLLNKKNSNFSIYGHKGYLKFIQDILVKDPETDYGYASELLSIIIKHTNDNISEKESFKSSFRDSDFSKIDETDSENNEVSYFSTGSRRNSKGAANNNLNQNTIKHLQLNYFPCREVDFSPCQLNQFNEIIEMPKSETYQYYLILAFYLLEYAENIDNILDFFKKAHICDKKAFPRIRFLQFLHEFELKDLKKFINSDSKDYKLIKTILNYRIGQIEGGKHKKDDMVLNRHRNRKVKVEIIDHDSDREEEENLLGFESNHLHFQSGQDFNTNSNKQLFSKFDSKKSNPKVNSEEKIFAPTRKKSNSSVTRKSSADNRDLTKPPLRKHTEKNLNFKSSHHIANLNSSSRKSSAHIYFNTRASLFGDIFDNKLDANKFIESMKSIDNKESTIVKKYLINGSSVSHKQIKSSSRDPISLIEDISVRIFSLILKNSLNKFKPEIFSPNLFSSISNSNEFLEIKYLIYELKCIKLGNLMNDVLKTCFWINVFNFLTIFTLIFKREVPSNYYEWYCFLKNSYFSIGGFEMSLYEIENCILKNTFVYQNNYGAVPVFNGDDPRKVLVINNLPKNSSYGISLPTLSSPGLRIYFPNNLVDLLRLNAIEFFTKNVQIDIENYLIYIPEYINWSDPQFIDHIMKYEELVSPEFAKFIFSRKDELGKSVVKYVWFINLTNIG